MCEDRHMWQVHKAVHSALLFAVHSFGSEDAQLLKQLAQKCLLIHYCFYIRQTHHISDSFVHVLIARCPLFVSVLCGLSESSKRLAYHEDYSSM